jgi:hypothetical protein
MSPFTLSIGQTTLLMRSVAIAALLSATFLAIPLTEARADSVIHAPIRSVQAATPKHPEGRPTGTYEDAQGGVKEKQIAAARATKAETVEQRITKLHRELKITAAEKSKWNDVARAMRDNAANMDKLIAANRQNPERTTAVDDLKTYAKFAQTHVEGLKNLMSSFEMLYDSMPDAQKKIADKVFRTAAHRGTPSHG